MNTSTQHTQEIPKPTQLVSDGAASSTTAAPTFDRSEYDVFSQRGCKKKIEGINYDGFKLISYDEFPSVFIIYQDIVLWMAENDVNIGLTEDHEEYQYAEEMTEQFVKDNRTQIYF